MTLPEAKVIWDKFFEKNVYIEEEIFLFSEAAHFLIRETQDAAYMHSLAVVYEWIESYDLAYKYYKMAAEQGCKYSYLGLGDIWYYGRTGKTDYEKAFYYFLKCDDDLNAQYKIADMYKNGYYVEKDEKKYREIIEQLYKDHYHSTDDWNDASIAFRLGKIRAAEGKTKEAIQLLSEAKESLEWCISENASFDSYSFMQDVIEKLYDLKPLDTANMNFFDLYELLKKPIKVQFTYYGKKYTIESSEEEDGTIAVCFDGKWYRTINDMMMNAKINGKLVTKNIWSVEDIRINV